MKTKSKKKEQAVRDRLTEFRESVSEPIRQRVGTGGEKGASDLTWVIRGMSIDIECKRIMSKTNKSTLPRPDQTASGLEHIEAGGLSVAIDLNNVEDFLQLLIDCDYDLDAFRYAPEYIDNFEISNWGLPVTSLEF